MASTSVTLGDWGKYFNLHSGSGSTNYRGYFLNGNQAASQVYPFPVVPKRGTSNTSRAVIVGIGMDVGGYNEAGDLRFSIWSSGGTSNLYYSDRIRTGNDGTTIDVSRKTLDIASGTKDDAIGGVDGTVPPVLVTSSTATTNYRFGLFNTSGYSVSWQKQVNSGENVDRDSTSSAGAAFQTDITDSDFTLIGRIYYVYLPSAPGLISATAGVREITVSFNPPTDNGGDDNYEGSSWYDVTGRIGMECTVEVALDSLFSTIVAAQTFAPGDTSGTISGLDNGTTYYVRMFATNEASVWLGDTSAYSSTKTATTTPLPAFTSVVLPSTSVYGQPVVGAVSATNATSYSEVSTSPLTGLPSGVTINSAGILSGIPTEIGTFTYKARATGPAGTTDTSTQTLVVSPNGPWVVTDKDTTPITKARSTLKVRASDAWVNGIMRVYDDSSPAADGTYWHPLT